MKKHGCGTCVYAEMDQDMEALRCLRNPPQCYPIGDDDMMTVFPLVDGDMWCG